MASPNQPSSPWNKDASAPTFDQLRNSELHKALKALADHHIDQGASTMDFCLALTAAACYVAWVAARGDNNEAADRINEYAELSTKALKLASIETREGRLNPTSGSANGRP